MIVVIHHFGQNIYPFNSNIFFRIAHYGDESVNYFFILSGFIMVVAYYKPANALVQFNKRKYFINRFARIYPVYLLALLLLVLFVTGFDKSLYMHFGLRLPLEFLLVQSWVGKTSLNFPGWTLSVEMFFYICFPFLLQFLSKRTNWELVVSGSLVFFLNLIANIYFSDSYKLESNVGLFQHFSPVFHIATFVEGIIAGLLFIKNYNFLKNKQFRIKIICYTLASLYLLISITAFNFPKYHHNGLLVPAYFLFILAFSFESKWTSFYSNRLFVYLGDISYSLYILQVPVWLFYRHFTAGMSLDNNLSFYLYLLILMAVSSLVYSFYERTVQNWIKTQSRYLLK